MKQVNKPKQPVIVVNKPTWTTENTNNEIPVLAICGRYDAAAVAGRKKTK